MKVNCIKLQYLFCKRKLSAILGLVILIPALGTSVSFAQTSGNGATGLPVPRFASLKSAKVNMRVGPGTEFQVKWLYNKKGLPVEIIQEYDNWRKVRDPLGDEGWILHSLLSGKRTAMVVPAELSRPASNISLMRSANPESAEIAKIEPGVVVSVVSCQEQWCRVSARNLQGHIEKRLIWGVYPDELIE